TLSCCPYTTLFRSHFLGRIRQHGHVQGVAWQQFGQHAATQAAAQALRLGVVHIEEMPTYPIPERRVALLVADARDLHRYRVGKALGMGGGEQQPATGVELERVVAA